MRKLDRHYGWVVRVEDADELLSSEELYEALDLADFLEPIEYLPIEIPWYKTSYVMSGLYVFLRVSGTKLRIYLGVSGNRPIRTACSCVLEIAKRRP
ncbi:hypothetical protein A9D60_24105 [Leisingera sp. JC1]|nr:hypothetical protein A9D60_24105 [Leisingera sp. JC1]